MTKKNQNFSEKHATWIRDIYVVFSLIDDILLVYSFA